MANQGEVTPRPYSPAKVIEGPAQASWNEFGKTAAITPQEAILKDPRKNSIDPKLGQG